jgi:hypothetical protein
MRRELIVANKNLIGKILLRHRSKKILKGQVPQLPPPTPLWIAMVDIWAYSYSILKQKEILCRNYQQRISDVIIFMKNSTQIIF